MDEAIEKRPNNYLFFKKKNKYSWMQIKLVRLKVNFPFFFLSKQGKVPLELDKL